MRTPEEIQTEMMAEMIRVKVGELKSLEKAMLVEPRKVERKKVTPSLPTQDPSTVLNSLEKLLTSSLDDVELLRSLDLLVPLLIGMSTSSSHWLVRDKAIECLSLIRRKMGIQLVEKHLKEVIPERRQRKILKEMI